MEWSTMKNSKEEGTSYGQTGRKADKQTGKGRVGDGGGAEFFSNRKCKQIHLSFYKELAQHSKAYI